MGKIADELNELSRNDNALIVGSEIRAAIAELEKENAELKRLNTLCPMYGKCPFCGYR